MTNTETNSPHVRPEVRAASYVGLVRRRKGSEDFEIYLGWAPPSETHPGHFGFFGGGHDEKVQFTWFPPSRRRSPEQPSEAARREFGEEAGRRISERRLQLALVVRTPNPIREDSSQDTYVYAASFNRVLHREPRESEEMKGGRWFTMNEAIESAVKGEIIDVNVLLGIQAVTEAHLIKQLRRSIVRRKEGLTEEQIDQRIRSDRRIIIYQGGKEKADDFLRLMQEEITKRREEQAESSLSLSDSANLG